MIRRGEFSLSKPKSLPTQRQSFFSAQTLLNICQLSSLTYCPSDPVVVRFANSADGRDARFAQEVGCQVAEPLLCDHHVRLEAGNLLTRLLDPLLLHLEQRGPAQQKQALIKLGFVGLYSVRRRRNSK